MGKKTAIVIGFIFFLLGVVGVYNAASSIGAAPVEKKDLETKGVITEVFVDVLEHKLTGVDLDKHFQFDYEFVAENGETYHGTETISEAEAEILAEGQKITIQYHSHNPGVNAAKGYGVYLPVDSFVEHSASTRIIVCSVFGFLGMILLYTGFTYKEDGEQDLAENEQFFEKPPEQPAAPADAEVVDEQMEKLERYRQAYMANQK